MEKIFVDGFMWKDANEKAPDFIKGKILINADKFISWLQSHAGYQSEKGWLGIEMKESKGGSIYFELDTWKPDKERKEVAEPNDALANIPF